MHQQFVQWVDDDIEVVQADDSGSIKASIASQERTGVKVLLNQSAVINS
jgi:hypothetical protein